MLGGTLVMVILTAREVKIGLRVGKGEAKEEERREEPMHRLDAEEILQFPTRLRCSEADNGS